MLVRIPRLLLKNYLRWTQIVLLAVAVFMLAWCGYVYGSSWLFQRHAQARLADAVRERVNIAAQRDALPESEDAGAPEAGMPDASLPEGLIGNIAIARLGISVVLMEGTGESVLQHAAGHVAGTSLPGEPGNVGVAAHRDTFFRPLQNVRSSDVIVLTTPTGEYEYRVVAVKIVNPSDVEVLSATQGETLTLVTCYPFYFIGSAPERFIVRAQRIS